MAIYEENVKKEIKRMFTEGVLMSVRDVAEYCDVAIPTITQHALAGHIDPIFIVKESKKIVRIFFRPDIVFYNKYRKEKGKFDGYEPYLKRIDTPDRKAVKRLLEKSIWNKYEVCEYLGVTIGVLNRLVDNGKMNVYYEFSEHSTRLFYISDVKEFKLEYDTYLKFVTPLKRQKKK